MDVRLEAVEIGIADKLARRPAGPEKRPVTKLGILGAGMMGAGVAYVSAYALLSSVPVQILIFGWVLSFSYHLLNGIRHLVWDTGRALDVKTAYTLGWAVLIGTVVLAAALLGAMS